MRPKRQSGLARVFTTPAPAPGRRALDREQMVQAALALLDEVGLEGLTMRRLAERLGVKAASLYWHVHDKEELLALLAEAIISELHLEDEGLSWREGIIALGHEYRRALLAHRDGAKVLAATPPFGPRRLQLMEGLFSLLLRWGFSRRDAAYAGFLMNDFITEFVIEEERTTEVASLEGTTERELFEDMQRYLASLPAETYPSLTRLADYLTGADTVKRFEFGLNVILDGLECRLRASSGDAGE
ncbi:MAG TPA: TetR/AcrR family transcriptional regulator C-terminal domain-containing protein [Ktedonobacterales bacterium]|nr:TetR/AcrR family transcriptional regulator C-terminal domain-containing protein [Ktedonobacterales bacterium]